MSSVHQDMTKILWKYQVKGEVGKEGGESRLNVFLVRHLSDQDGWLVTKGLYHTAHVITVKDIDGYVSPIFFSSVYVQLWYEIFKKELFKHKNRSRVCHTPSSFQ